MSYFNKITTKFEPSNMSAFGTLEAVGMTPVFQTDFIHGINIQTWNPAVVNGSGATVDTNAGRLRIQSGTVAGNYSYITSRKIVRYRAGSGITARFTPLFTTGVASSLQAWGVGSIIANALYDGYFFAFNGASFSVVHYNKGTPTFVPQTAWNIDKVDGSTGTAFNWNSTFGSPVQIKYPYLGYGDIEFFVQNPATGAWVLVHVIQYANTTVATQLGNPSLQFLGFVSNTSNTTNLTMYCGSIGIFISGERNFVSNPKWCCDGIVAAIAANEKPLFVIRNCSSYNGVTNKGMIRLNSISMGTKDAHSVAIRMRIGGVTAGTPAFVGTSGTVASALDGLTITNGNSIASVDTTGSSMNSIVPSSTLSTTGQYVFNLSSSTGGSVIDLTPYELYLAPGELLSVTLQASGNASCNCSLNWSEDI